jgi:hypothetical protein
VRALEAGFPIIRANKGKANRQQRRPGRRPLYGFLLL